MLRRDSEYRRADEGGLSDRICHWFTVGKAYRRRAGLTNS